jgi:hypothetical protein
VDRPHNGHGRHDTGTITVVDLMKRQQHPVRIPSADELDRLGFVDDLLGPAPADERHRGWAARAAKFVGLGVGSLVLCGSVVAASTLTRTHRVPAPAAAPPGSTVLTGVDALRPDTLAAQLSGHHPVPPPPAPVTTTPDAKSAAPGNVSPAQAAPPTGGATKQSAGAPSGPMSAADLVREFFNEASTSPLAAAHLIDPSLLATDPTGFARSWLNTEQLTIESVRTNPDGTVQAVVHLLDSDGTRMRVVELLHVTDGDNPVITGAELLSAQRG